MRTIQEAGDDARGPWSAAMTTARHARTSSAARSEACDAGTAAAAVGFYVVNVACAQMVDKEQDDLYVRFKTLQRQLEFIEIQVCRLCLVPGLPAVLSAPAGERCVHERRV